MVALILEPSFDLGSHSGAGIDLSRLQPPEPEVLETHLAPLLGAPMNPRALQQIKKIILDHYKQVGRLFLDVGFPPQDITDGILAVIVTEFRVGQIKTKGNDWFSDHLIIDSAALTSGDTIDKAALDKRIVTLNANPFLKVTPEFQSGSAPGTTDVTLKAVDRFPVDFSLGYANTGSKTTGWDRVNLGANWGNALQMGQTLNYQLSTSADVWRGIVHDMLRSKDPNLVSNTLTWSVPLSWGDTFSATGVHSRSIPSLGSSIGSPGITDTLGLSYQMPLTDAQQISWGLDYKRSNNQLAYGGVTVQKGFTEIVEASLHYNLSFATSLGQTALENVLTLSPGGLTAGNRDGSYQSSSTHSGTTGAQARFAYDKITLTETIPLDAEFGLTLRSSFQQASGTLLGSEQFSIAGADAVRGYQEFGLAGSGGFLVSAELTGPVFHVGLPDDSWQPHLFYDEGQAWNPIVSSTAPAYEHSASVGIGGRAQVGRNLTLRFEEGWQLQRSSRQGARGAFLHVATTATW